MARIIANGMRVNSRNARLALIGVYPRMAAWLPRGFTPGPSVVKEKALRLSASPASLRWGRFRLVAAPPRRAFALNLNRIVPAQSGLFPGRFPAQVFLFGGVNADDFAVGDEQRNHDLEAGFELRLLP